MTIYIPLVIHEINMDLCVCISMQTLEQECWEFGIGLDRYIPEDLIAVLL